MTAANQPICCSSISISMVVQGYEHDGIRLQSTAVPLLSSAMQSLYRKEKVQRRAVLAERSALMARPGPVKFATHARPRFHKTKRRSVELRRFEYY
ncbi:MAG: hypothetical protein SV422_11995, partial [Pseudomonadota bacterium]|nr:hypothetical protein [Pseudomonadota bacterium]